MIDIKSFSDNDLKRYRARGDKSKVDPRLHDDLDDYLDTMAASTNLKLIRAFPEYHIWPNTPKGPDRVHSLPLSGNYRLLFHFDKERGYFFNIRISDPHKKGSKKSKK